MTNDTFHDIDALVLRVTPYGNTSAYLLCLSKTHGKIMLRARGALRRGSTLIAYAQPLVYAQFSVFDYRGKFTINDAEAHSFFMPMRNELAKLETAAYIAEIADKLSDTDAQDEQLLDLCLHSLQRLCESRYTAEHIRAVFTWRAAVIGGYGFDFDTPAGLGLNNLPHLTIAGLQAVQHAQTAPPERLFAFAVEDDGWHQTGEDYLRWYIG